MKAQMFEEMDDYIKVNCRPGQKADWTEAAKVLGYPDRSAWVRAVLNEQADLALAHTKQEENNVRERQPG